MTKLKADLIIDNAAELVTCAPIGTDKIGRIYGGSIAVADEKIIAVGKSPEIKECVDFHSAIYIDASGKIVAPGFIDCHTHLVFGRDRVKEFSDRLTLNEKQILKLNYPVGIQASVKMTRDASEDDLYESSLDRLNRMMASGTTTVESKSGYGLSLEAELKQLRVNKRLNAAHPVDVISTLLGGHDFPPEIDRQNAIDRNCYIDDLIKNIIPAVAERNYAVFCDVYCDRGYFTVDEARRILEAGKTHGLRSKIHADAYSGMGGAVLAAEIGAISADHLNYSTKDEMHKLAKAGVVGVVLPALDFAANHPNPSDARTMLDEGMTLALATNLNPGNWTESMQFVMVLACRRHMMSPTEAMLCATSGAAAALGIEPVVGCLQEGKMADIQIWDLPTFEHIIYRLGNNAVESVIKRGNICYSKNNKSIFQKDKSLN